MANSNIYKDIAARTGGDIYIGVVGPVRTGKSTFIKRFMEAVVLPNIGEGYSRDRARDELPQSAAGKTVMTTEPKFIPEEAVPVVLDNNAQMRVRMIDCVGYVISQAKGYMDEDGMRMVKTPWYDEEIPFVEAAEIGTEKVIRDHSSIGIVVTTDGSFGEFSRDDYIEAEETVINELNEIGKPYIVLLNSVNPGAETTLELAGKLRTKYNVPVLPINVEQMQERDMYNILKEALYEFPVVEVKVKVLSKFLNKTTQTATNYPVDNIPGSFAEGYDVQMAKLIAEKLVCLTPLSPFYYIVVNIKAFIK